MTDMIAEMAERLFASHKPGAVGAGALWAAVEEAGLPLALLSEVEGGFGFAPAEALGIVRIAASHAAEAPVAETLLANRVLAAAGLESSSRPAAVVTGLATDAGYLRGRARRVPWGRSLAVIVCVTTDSRILRLESGWRHEEGSNLAAEPRDDLTFDIATADIPCTDSPVDAGTALAMGAALRAIAIAGAAEAALRLTVGYANDRVQFGRPIGKLQAIQQTLAVMASQVAAARAAADLVAEAFPLALTAPDLFHLLAGAAKLRAGEAAGICASIAHQVHGAIGITREYPLHRLTCRLWSWRDEYGGETHWAEQIGAAAIARRTDGLWPFLTQGEAVR